MQAPGEPSRTPSPAEGSDSLAMTSTRSPRPDPMRLTPHEPPGKCVLRTPIHRPAPEPPAVRSLTGGGRSTQCGSDPSERDLDREPRAAAAFRFDVERAIDRCGSLAHSDEPEPVTGYPRAGEAATVVVDRENHESFLSRERDVHGLRVGVLDDVC